MKSNSIFTVFLISIVLVSCASTTKVTSTKVVPIEMVALTFTFTPITLTATPTLNPLANAPVGAMGIDKDGKYYMEAKNGNTYTEYDEKMDMWFRIDNESGKTVYYDSERKEEVSLLFEDDLWDMSPELEGNVMLDGKSKITDQLRFKVFIDPNILNWNKLTITHAENMDAANNSTNWTSLFQTLLFEKMRYRGLIEGNFQLINWVSEGYTIQYTTKEGAQTLFLGDGSVTTVHILGNFDTLKADQENNNFTEVVGGDLGGVAIRYMVKISSDENGNTKVEIAPNQKDALQWSDKRIIEMILLGFSDALCIPDEILIPRASTFSTELAENHVARPYFIFNRTK